MHKVVQTNQHGIVKDLSTGCLLNRNTQELALYKLERQKILQSKETEKRISNLENGIEEIKTLLLKVLAKND